MYFFNIEKVDLDKFIANSNKIYAHILNERKERLKEHIDLAVEYLYKIIESKKLDNVFLNFENGLVNELSLKGKNFYREMLLNTIYMHDLGKINCNFQYVKMGNNEFKNAKGLSVNNTNHSMLSSLIYLNHYFNEIEGHDVKEDREDLTIFMLLNAYIISKHHGALDSFDEFKEKLLDDDGEGKRLYTDQLSIFNEVYKEQIIFNKENKLLMRIFNVVEKSLARKEEENKEISICFYIYERFLSSLLLACDYYSTSHFKNQSEIKELGEIDDINKFYDVFKNTEVYKSIRQYEKESYCKTNDFSNIKNINILRNEMFLDAENSFLENLDNNIFYLEAPTGSGKSNVSLNLSFRIIEKCKDINKIFYVYPFNTLVEQNIKTMENIFESSSVMKDIAVINSVVPIKTKGKVIKERRKKDADENEDSDVINYEEALLDRQFLHYPIVLTTHISIFNYLFGTSKDNLFPLAQMANSVVVLDEIQSYRNSIWKEIITFLKYYSELLNIKFIIMSATLPNLNKLIDGDIETVTLIGDREKYFKNPIFKNRVVPDFSLLEVEGNVKEQLLKHVIKTSKKIEGNILIEFIKKDTATKFFKDLIECRSELSKGDKEKQIELMTGDDNSIERNIIINKIKNNKNIILVATQVIEAGVDIDMDIGYKDISMLDSEEQFLGRINRSCKKLQCKVYFFDLDAASNIYKNDIRKEKNINLKSKDIRDILINKNFQDFYDYVLKELNKHASNLTDKNFNDFIKNSINKLNFKQIEERMKLIDERYEYSAFLNRTLKLENGEILDGEKVWNDYISLLKGSSLDYAEQKVRLSEVKSKLNYFIYKVNKNDFSYEDRIGDLYYIEDGEKYFENGKFNRENFNKGIGDFI
ncbi:CRISPR-associated helicase Cas3' [Clostridium brassicae]|uniref:CRISPR-associated helicase Cas3 n=1 Tax=Clostridium brassicae TaxID=2999072 RepID=A0ABT4DAW0_9CLOT|nr:CRISPR-associated helicase Cas3' [Clostridium brassicae]MCY6958356.1 CRISPR-associated helicase Cas3' [Clostridium brassicae]